MGHRANFIQEFIRDEQTLGVDQRANEYDITQLLAGCAESKKSVQALCKELLGLAPVSWMIILANLLTVGDFGELSIHQNEAQAMFLVALALKEFPEKDFETAIAFHLYHVVEKGLSVHFDVDREKLRTCLRILQYGSSAEVAKVKGMTMQVLWDEEAVSSVWKEDAHLFKEGEGWQDWDDLLNPAGGLIVVDVGSMPLTTPVSPSSSINLTSTSSTALTTTKPAAKREEDDIFVHGYEKTEFTMIR